MSPDDFGEALLNGLTSNFHATPNHELEESQWPASPQAAVQSAFLRETTKQLVEQALTKSVPRLFSHAAAVQ